MHDCTTGSRWPGHGMAKPRGGMVGWWRPHHKVLFNTISFVRINLLLVNGCITFVVSFIRQSLARWPPSYGLPYPATPPGPMMRGSPTRTHKPKQRKRFHGTPEETPFQRSATRIGNLYDRNPGSRLVKKRAEMWCRLPSLHSWEAPMLNKRPGSIRAASRAADRAEREKRQQTKSKRERKNWLAGDSYTPGTPAQLFARYGARGAMNIVLRENSDAILHQDWAPKFLNPPIKEDEWVPRMHGSPAQWPLKATYVHGSDLRPKPKAVQHDPRYLKTCGRLEEQLGGLECRAYRAS